MQNNDLISRSALLEDINFDRRAAKVHPQEICERLERFCDYAETLVEQTSAVDAEVVRHGRWIPVMESTILGQEFEDGHKCSVCGSKSLYSCADYVAYDELSNYCPHCGCKMDAEVEG